MFQTIATLSLLFAAVAVATSSPVSSSQVKARWQCDTAYPTDHNVCIPQVAINVDLDCGDISYRQFKVIIGQDRHGFDGDRDAIGCENVRQLCTGNYCGRP